MVYILIAVSVNVGEISREKGAMNFETKCDRVIRSYK